MPYFKYLFDSIFKTYTENKVIQEIKDYFMNKDLIYYLNDIDSSLMGYHPNTIIVITEGKVNPEDYDFTM